MHCFQTHEYHQGWRACSSSGVGGWPLEAIVVQCLPQEHRHRQNHPEHRQLTQAPHVSRTWPAAVARRRWRGSWRRLACASARPAAPPRAPAHGGRAAVRTRATQPTSRRPGAGGAPPAMTTWQRPGRALTGALTCSPVSWAGLAEQNMRSCWDHTSPGPHPLLLNHIIAIGSWRHEAPQWPLLMCALQRTCTNQCSSPAGTCCLTLCALTRQVC